MTSYMRYGYIRLEDHVPDAFHGNEQVSRTLEYAYDDFLVGEMAEWLGHKADAKLFEVRGQNEDGSWATPFDPAKKYTYITEGLPFQYTFFVPQDVPGFIEIVGGRQA